MRGLIFLALIFTCIVFGCRKEDRISTDPDARLDFSTDSVLFDTVFTSVGSVTKRFKVLNKNTSAISISEIKLAGGGLSSFSININGESITNRKNLVISAGDSVIFFVKVNINPDDKQLPFIVQDSILFSTNGNQQAVHFIAYGQNAVFVNKSSINSDITWSSALPYVITGALTVRNNTTLTIKPGAKLYFHKDASLNIEGNLSATGTADKPIMFCSDRLESAYTDEPGQWKGIFIKPTANATIAYATIKNASVGITSDSLSKNAIPKLILSNAVIKNMQVSGYIGNHSELIAFNSLFYNCGNYLLYAVGGGNYNLKQNTFVGYNPNFPRKTAALTFSDYLSVKAYNKLNLNLTNNIIWGQLNNELDIQKKTTAAIESRIWNNLIKTNATTFSNNDNLINSDPGFINTTLGNFELTNSSSALKKGYNLSNDLYFNDYLNHDLKNDPRFFPSTLGCFEKN
ncbi:hypothetical protein [Pedobacter agri]|uniref:hypothetical protein n=1 Tax=Pedobacter agri TaxID=454586 RepID=UPI002786D09F|nr:hypothetical protein [Pedobacter agri]MDQ1141190.1 hypothetical protein [Pedobacter agri]